MKGAKQPQAFPKESPETAAQKESNLVQHTQMNYVSRNLLLQEVWVFSTLRSYIINIPRKAAIGKYVFHKKTMGERKWLCVEYCIIIMIKSDIFISFFKLMLYLEACYELKYIKNKLENIPNTIHYIQKKL